MTTQLDDAKRAEYTALTKAMTLPEILGDPAKNAEQVSARLDAIKTLLTPDAVFQIISEEQKQVMQALYHQTTDPIRYIVLIYASMPSLLRRLLGNASEKPRALSGLPIDQARIDDPTSAVVRDCDPTKQFVLVVATALGDSAYMVQSRTLLSMRSRTLETPQSRIDVVEK